ncbi:hypothetical protein HID58_020332 [Brassica napus]|uniref:Uncharacterized protein n=1 Tax=Brassica napus TaxID=3708 RepID=A0ABQ8DFF6_BRANA|nr:hypothetical protein HID58_020332 [Brassica napus]
MVEMEDEDVDIGYNEQPIPASLLSGHTRIRQWGTLLVRNSAHQNERQVPPEKLHRAALLKNQYADLILKARERICQDLVKEKTNTLPDTDIEAALTPMESDAGSSVARRRRRLSVVVISFVSLPLHVTLLLHEFLVGLGFLCSLIVAMCWRCCHLKLLRRVFPSSSPTTLNFLPSGKIDANWFSCPCGSRTSLPGSLFVRSMRLNGSKYYYRTISTKLLPFDDPRTNPCLLQTPFEAAHTDDCSNFLSLLDHNDQWLGFGSVKSPGLQHGNAGVGSVCLESTLVHSEVGVKPISLSAGIKVKSSLTTNFFMVKIHSCNAVPARLLEWFRCWVHKGQSLQAMKYLFVDSMVNILQQCSASSSNLRLLKLDRNSPFKSSFEDEFNQISSRQGRERSFSMSSFSKERIIPPISLCIRGDPLPAFKTRKNYQFPSRLLSCVKVRLGPVDATTLIRMRVEVLDGAATSYAIVTNRSLFEDFEVRFNRIASGNFNIFRNILSNFYKFVSLSSYSIVLYVWGLAFCFAHRGLYDVASTQKARLQAEAKEAEEARRKAEAEAANWNLKEKQPAKLCLS